MEILIRGDKVKVTEAMKEYINEKLGRLEKYIEDYDDVKATVVIKIKKIGQKVEVTIPLKKLILRAEETQDDVYAAIDVITDKIERQIRKNKTKIQANKKVKDYKDIVIDEIDDSDKEENVVVKRKKIEVKPMNEDEAILQMELLGHSFYMFKDDITLKPTLVYKREDGNYGIIETD